MIITSSAIVLMQSEDEFYVNGFPIKCNLRVALQAGGHVSYDSPKQVIIADSTDTTTVDVQFKPLQEKSKENSKGNSK